MAEKKSSESVLSGSPNVSWGGRESCESRPAPGGGPTGSRRGPTHQELAVGVLSLLSFLVQRFELAAVALHKHL